MHSHSAMHLQQNTAPSKNKPDDPQTQSDTTEINPVRGGYSKPMTHAERQAFLQNSELGKLFGLTN